MMFRECHVIVGPKNEPQSVAFFTHDLTNPQNQYCFKNIE